MIPDHNPTANDLLAFEPELVRANTSKRLANYIIDVIAFYILALVVGMLWLIVNPEAVEAYASSDSVGDGLLDRLISIIAYGIFMGVIEAVFKGKSLGKLITKTRAVNLDGTAISTQTAFLRGLSRAVPFCVFSAFGTPCDPWQDRWTKTMVADEGAI